MANWTWGDGLRELTIPFFSAVAVPKRKKLAARTSHPVPIPCLIRIALDMQEEESTSPWPVEELRVASGISYRMPNFKGAKEVFGSRRIRQAQVAGPLKGCTKRVRSGLSV